MNRPAAAGHRFTGEQAITSGMLEVTEGKKERRLLRPAATANPALAKGKQLEDAHRRPARRRASHRRGVEPARTFDAAPADATVIMLVGARYDLSDREVKLLSDYWDKGGRLLVLLNPDFPTPHLAGFLTRLGVKPDDDRILGQANIARREKTHRRCRHALRR